MMTSKVLRRSLQKDMNRSRRPSKFAMSKVLEYWTFISADSLNNATRDGPLVSNITLFWTNFCV